MLEPASQPPDYEMYRIELVEMYSNRSDKINNFHKMYNKSSFYSISQQFLKKFSPVYTNLLESPCSNHCREADICLEANDRIILKQKIESQLLLNSKSTSSSSLLHKVSEISY